jgi:hypothetical protein
MDEKSLERKKRDEELREALEQRKADFKQTFEDGPGQRVYKYLAEFCFKNKSTFNASSQSTCNFNEGSRYVILEIDKWLNFDLKGKL